MRANFALRIRYIAIAFAFIAIVIIVRLYLVQIVHGSEYRDKAANQHVAPSSHVLDRGTIYFTAKDGSLISAATLKSGFTIALNPRLLKDPESAYEKLHAIIPELNRDEFMEKASKKNDPYEELGRRFDEEVGMAVLALKTPGIEAYRERWRFYPGGSLAGHEIGFLGFGKGTSTVETGQYGLERSYETALSKKGTGSSMNFFADLFTNVGSRFFSNEADPGADVVTSIEPTVQAYLEDTLSAYDSKWNAKTIGGIIMDPKTGAILAMASRPVYDPNDFKNADPRALSNPLVEGTFEFGSTMKPITMAAALDSGAVTPRTTYNDTGTLTIDKKTFSNFDGKARGVVPMQEILSQSLNVGIAFIVQKMGTDTTREYFEKFGITEETGIDLPSEQSPQVANLDSPRTIEYITAGYGQGIAITPVGMARALATLANHGQVPAPHVGTELRYPGGITKDLGWAPPRQAIRPETSETVTRMLVTVVDTALRHGEVRIPEMSVAAKTGTAQIANPNGGGYYADRYLHSFFGYFPAYEPRFLVFFFAVEPVGAKYASETWTDPFIKTVGFLTTYYQVPPDRPQTATTTKP